MNAIFYKIKSFTDPNVEYTVRHMPAGEWLCDCPGFMFQFRQKNQVCDHIRKARHMKLKTHGRKKNDNKTK